MNHNNDISAAELLQRLKNQEVLNLLDVREHIEYHTRNIGGQNIPVGKLAGQLNQLPYNLNDEIIVICSAGLRSETAQSILEQNGYQNVRNVTGGLLAIEKIQSL
ncbi:rhodanese-like domain-containing protein [Mucilaginibacter sp. RS28]|uniref:Rhodanese-like domain-containing protein n=1 Tax=Mucilaginibacter straminoryzae TaxID=2932774 RepID=A0A9X2BB79_9SPHI|nr:rhodanese-like domain-containing protein [Mucilaginibacter straminoryzae]MCJ8209552.1 rhodanese-like domain-containing protein [Mucilaginibacter straminoryzae]